MRPWFPGKDDPIQSAEIDLYSQPIAALIATPRPGAPAASTQPYSNPTGMTPVATTKAMIENPVLYIVDPYLGNLKGSTSISQDDVLAAVGTDQSYGQVQASGLITDGTATAIAVYKSSINSPVKFSGTDGLRFSGWSGSFLAQSPSTWTSGNSNSVQPYQKNGIYYSLVLVLAPVQHNSPNYPYGPNAAQISAQLTQHSDQSVTKPPIPLDIEPTPIVFIHGLWGSASSLSTIASEFVGGPWGAAPFGVTELEQICYSTTLRFDAPPTGGAGCAVSSQDAVNGGIAQIDDGLDSAHYVGGRVDVVAHSMGGLVARHYIAAGKYYTARSANRGLFRTVITIDTPENGSALAGFLLNRDVAGGTCDWQNQGGACVTSMAITPAAEVWSLLCGHLTLARCFANKGNPLGPPGAGPGGFNTNLCQSDANCGAVASLVPNNPSLTSLPPLQRLTGTGSRLHRTGRIRI